MRLLGHPLGSRLAEFKMLRCSGYSWVSPGGSRRCRAVSKEVSGGQGEPRAPERWPKSSGRGLDDDFLIVAFSCQVWSVSVFLIVSDWLQEV